MRHSAVVGGSTAERIIACPPSRLSGVEIPEGPMNEYALRGSVLHSCMEYLLRDDADPESLLGARVVGSQEDPRGIEITRGLMDEKIVPAHQALLEYTFKHPVRQIAIEQSIRLAPVDPKAFGTSDIILYHTDNTVTVWDWKFGDGIQVFPENNAQLMFYAASALFHFKLWEYDGFRLVICQPNDQGRPIVREARVTKSDLIEFTSRLRWAVKNGHRNELLNSGPHCRFCPVKPICPKLIEEHTRITGWTDPFPDLTDAELGLLLDAAEAAEVRIAALRELARERLENARPVAGWKLVPSQPRRAWVEEEQDRVVAKILAANPTASIDDIVAIKLNSPAQIEKRKLVVPDELITKKSSGTVLVPATDSREPAVAKGGIERLAATLKAKLGN